MTTATLETPTLDERIATRVAELQQQRDAIPSDGQLPVSTTRDEAAAFAEQRATLARRIAHIQTVADTLATLGSAEADERWITDLTTWRATLCADLLAIKSPMRDADTQARAQDLTFAIRLIDVGLGAFTIGPLVSLAPMRIGPLMTEAGYAVEGPSLRGPNGWRGSLPEVQQRSKALAQQRTAACAALEEALLTDEERATRDAKHQSFREVLNTMRITHNDRGTGLVAYTQDGDVLHVSDMTPVERTAFAWLEAAQR